MAVLADPRQNMIADDVGQRPVAKDIEGRAALGVGPAAGPQKSKGRIHLAGHDKPVQPASEIPSPDGPVLSVHVLIFQSGNCAQYGDPDDEDK